VAVADARERVESVAHSGRDILLQRWIHTEDTYGRENPQRVYYLAMAFLLGRALANNVTNRLLQGDQYMHLADLRSYLEADQRLIALYADRDGWARRAIPNVPGSGYFSSDRTIAEYASDIWNAKLCVVK
jgi:glucan phosphorylase